MIVCHDMQGGYKEDHMNFNLKQKGKMNYRFNHWSICDIFIYFSHYLVSVPPKNYIDVSHRMGTQVLGTVITEGELGTSNNLQLFTQKYADRLIELCAFYNFDGWLINIEAEIYDYQKMEEWLIYLRKGIKQIN